MATRQRVLRSSPQTDQAGFHVSLYALPHFSVPFNGFLVQGCYSHPATLKLGVQPRQVAEDEVGAGKARSDGDLMACVPIQCGEYIADIKV